MTIFRKSLPYSGLGLLSYFALSIAFSLLADLTALAENTLKDCPECPSLTVVPVGIFSMGSTLEVDDTESDAQPVHSVTISKPFAIGTFEVTRGEYEDFVNANDYQSANACNVYDSEWWVLKEELSWQNPGFGQHREDPVVCISWNDAQQYVGWLGKKTGYHYRLPSESEWEYIAVVGRQGSTTGELSHNNANYGAADCCGPYVDGNDSWIHTSPVGSFDSDSFGLFDILGNVWEWLDDCYHDSYENAPSDSRARVTDCSSPNKRVVRGGSWRDRGQLLRATYRLRAPKEQAYFTLGFRVARDLD